MGVSPFSYVCIYFYESFWVVTQGLYMEYITEISTQMDRGIRKVMRK